MRLPSTEELNALDADSAIDLLFRQVDDALFAGDADKTWPDLDEWSREVDPEGLSIALIVGVLSITFPVRGEEWRKAWFDRAKTTLEVLAPERAERLLRHLGGTMPTTEKTAETGHGR
jgi:hypothetical protein